MKKIKQIKEDNSAIIYDTLQDAAATIDTKIENWKIQMLIVDAIAHNKKAFKSKWKVA